MSTQEGSQDARIVTENRLGYIDRATARITAQLEHLRNAASENRNSIALLGWVDSIAMEVHDLRKLLNQQ